LSVSSRGAGPASHRLRGTISRIRAADFPRPRNHKRSAALIRLEAFGRGVVKEG